MKQWDVQSEERQRRVAAGASFASGKAVDSNRLAEYLTMPVRVAALANRVDSITYRWMRACQLTQTRTMSLPNPQTP